MATETITVTFQIAACCAEGLITKLSVQMLTMSSLHHSAAFAIINRMTPSVLKGRAT